MKPPITDIPLKEIPKLVAELGLPPFAAGQIIRWLYGKRAASFDEMTNLSNEARVLLRKRYAIEAVVLDCFQTAGDGTKKFLCRAHDGAAVEAVLIPACPICHLRYTPTHIIDRLTFQSCAFEGKWRVK